MLNNAIESADWSPRGTPANALLDAGMSLPRSTPFDDLAAVHDLYEARIFRFLLLSLRDRDAALSLTQDTFLKAWRARASFRGDCAVGTWLMRIAVNLLRDHTKTEMFRFWKRASETAVQASDPALGLAHRATSAEAGMLATERLAQVWVTVQALSAKQRTIFLLRFVEGLELAEIAEVSGMSLPTVKTHLHRALDHVRRAERESNKITPAPRDNRGTL